jgi:hypothetical protein
VTADPIEQAAPLTDLIRARDWSTTPIGPADGWSPSLRTALSICLESRFPILIWWGPEFVMLYNDAYAPDREQASGRSGPARRRLLPRDLGSDRADAGAGA